MTNENEVNVTVHQKIIKYSQSIAKVSFMNIRYKYINWMLEFDRATFRKRLHIHLQKAHYFLNGLRVTDASLLRLK